jgi:hypothetical protein
MKRDLPKYKITIDDEYSEGENLGISMIAFTSKPAIMVKGMAFNVDEPTKLYFVDELKYRICAPVMVPMEIYRCDSNEEYFVQFTVEEIDTIHQKFMSNLTNKNIFNLEHKSENVMPAFVLEAWIVDNPETDKAMQTYGISVPKGTLMMTTQITDKQVYSNLVNGGQVGYSIEGFLGLKLSEMKMSEPPYHENCKCSLVDGEVKNEPGVCDYCLEQSQFNIVTLESDILSVETKNKEHKMEDKLNIPAGEYTDKDGNVFIVAEDGTISKQEMECKPKEEEMGIEIDETAEVEDNFGDKTKEEEKIKETELAEGDVVEEVPTDEPVKEAITYTKEEVDAKFDELYKLIGDMKAEEVEDIEEIELKKEDVKLSVNDRFEAFNRFFTNSRVDL